MGELGVKEDMPTLRALQLRPVMAQIVAMVAVLS